MTSCSLSKFLQGMQAERFSLNRHTEINRLINIDGIFFPEKAEIILPNFLFFEDGSCGPIYFDGNDFFPDMDDPQVYPGMDLQQSVVTFGKKNVFFSTGGSYALHNDTIEVDLYFMYQFSWGIRKYWFKVDDRNTLMLFQEDWDLGKDVTHPKQRNNRYHFIPVKSVPSPKGIAIKKKKWMWSDEKEWKQYRESLK